MDTPLCFTNRLWYTTSRVLFFMKFMFLKKMIGASCFGPMPCMGIVLTSFGHFSRGMVFPVSSIIFSRYMSYAGLSLLLYSIMTCSSGSGRMEALSLASKVDSYCPVMRSLCRSDISAWAQITISWK